MCSDVVATMFGSVYKSDMKREYTLYNIGGLVFYEILNENISEFQNNRRRCVVLSVLFYRHTFNNVRIHICGILSTFSIIPRWQSDILVWKHILYANCRSCYSSFSSINWVFIRKHFFFFCVCRVCVIVINSNWCYCNLYLHICRLNNFVDFEKPL